MLLFLMRNGRVRLQLFLAMLFVLGSIPDEVKGFDLKCKGCGDGGADCATPEEKTHTFGDVCYVKTDGNGGEKGKGILKAPFLVDCLKKEAQKNGDYFCVGKSIAGCDASELDAGDSKCICFCEGDNCNENDPPNSPICEPDLPPIKCKSTTTWINGPDAGKSTTRDVDCNKGVCIKKELGCADKEELKCLGKKECGKCGVGLGGKKDICICKTGNFCNKGGYEPPGGGLVDGKKGSGAGAPTFRGILILTSVLMTSAAYIFNSGGAFFVGAGGA